MHKIENLKYIGKLVNNKYYAKFIPHMIEVMDMTTHKEFLSLPAAHFEAQKAILQILEEHEPLITKGKAIAREKDDLSYKEQSDRNKLIATGYREIADGLAWRTLGFDRVRLRIIAQSQNPGFTSTPQGKKIGRPSELKYASNVVSNNVFVMMHDITTSFLVGDLSSYKSIGAKPHLAEIKSSKLITPHTILNKLKNNFKLSTQESRLYQAQIMIEEDSVIGGNKTAKTYRYNLPVKHFHQSAQYAISKAKKTGFASVKPAPYLMIEVTDFNNNSVTIETVKKLTRRFDKDFVIPFSNYENLAIKLRGEVFRAKTPYSVYPYWLVDRVAIMSGQLYLFALVSIDELKKTFLEQGWKFEINFPNEYEPFQNHQFGGYDLFKDLGTDDLLITLTNTKTGFVSKHGMDLLAKIGYEFLSVEAILAPLNAKMNDVVSKGKSHSAFSYAVNDFEKTIWR